LQFCFLHVAVGTLEFNSVSRHRLVIQIRSKVSRKCLDRSWRIVSLTLRLNDAYLREFDTDLASVTEELAVCKSVKMADTWGTRVVVSEARC
jgi:hypothetical protein